MRDSSVRIWRSQRGLGTGSWQSIAPFCVEYTAWVHRPGPNRIVRTLSRPNRTVALLAETRRHGVMTGGAAATVKSAVNSSLTQAVIAGTTDDHPVRPWLRSTERGRDDNSHRDLAGTATASASRRRFGPVVRVGRASAPSLGPSQRYQVGVDAPAAARCRPDISGEGAPSAAMASASAMPPNAAADHPTNAADKDP